MNDNEPTITSKDAQTTMRLRSCSVVLSVLETCSDDTSGAENGEKSSSNTKNRSTDSTEEVLGVERKSSENNEESTCDSEVNVRTENPDDFATAHSRNELYKFNTCAKSFKWKYSLTQNSKVHTNQGLRPYICNRCAKMFNQKCNVARHIKIHTGKGPINCQYCEKSFYQQSELKRHAVIHSDERNYGCVLCDKSSKRLDIMRSHMKFVHLNNRPLGCAQCGKLFWRKSQLRAHLRTCT